MLRAVDVVGRGREIAQLDAALDEVLVVRAARRRFAVVRGRATELERDVPLTLFADLRPAATGPDEDRPGAAPDRWSLGRTIAGELDRVAGRDPLAVVLDDVHWADPVSVEVLGTLLARGPRVPHLLALATRPGVAADALLVAARSAGRRPRLLDLGPLTPEAAGAVVDAVDGTRTPADRARITATAGGNPLLFEELARSASAALPAGLDADRVRWSVAELTAVRLLAPADADSARRLAFRHPVLRTAAYESLPVTARIAWHARAAAVLAAGGAGRRRSRVPWHRRRRPGISPPRGCCARPRTWSGRRGRRSRRTGTWRPTGPAR